MKLPKSSGQPRKRKLLIVRRVVGNSMLPTLRPQRLVLASGLFKTLPLEAVVVVQQGGMEKIKRVEKIRDDQVFVVGDNSSQSLDSRNFGWLPRSSVIAKVLWPRI